MKSGIYQIKNKINNKIYIGSSCDIRKRWSTHNYLLKLNKSNCKILQKAINKYGLENFSFEIVAYCPKEYLFKLEQWFVDNLNPNYNICKLNVSVPIGLKKHKYTKKQLEVKSKIAIERIKSGSFGQKLKKIEKIDLNGNVIKIYNSIKECALDIGSSPSSTSMYISRKTRTKGFILRHHN